MKDGKCQAVVWLDGGGRGGAARSEHSLERQGFNSLRTPCLPALPAPAPASPPSPAPEHICRELGLQTASGKGLMDGDTPAGAACACVWRAARSRARGCPCVTRRGTCFLSLRSRLCSLWKRLSDPFPPQPRRVPLEMDSVLNPEIGCKASSGGMRLWGALGTSFCKAHEQGGPPSVPWNHLDSRATAGVTVPPSRAKGTASGWPRCSHQQQ